MGRQHLILIDILDEMLSVPDVPLALFFIFFPGSVRGSKILTVFLFLNLIEFSLS